MIIELLKCNGCWRVWDNYHYGFGCEGCYSKLSRRVNPTKFNLIKWFLTNPKHVTKLVILDLMGKDYE